MAETASGNAVKHEIVTLEREDLLSGERRSDHPFLTGLLIYRLNLPNSRSG
jgi:hypothetical protein